MNLDHTLPGTLPAILQACTPVRVTSNDMEEPHLRFGTRGVVLAVNPDKDPFVAWIDGRVFSVPARRLGVDLENQTGLAHLAWWLRTRLVHMGVAQKRTDLTYPLACAESAWPMDVVDLETLKKIALECSP